MTQFPNPRKAAGQFRIPKHTENDPRQQPFWKARRLPPSPDVRTERRTGRRAPCPSGRRRRGPCRHRRTQAGPLPWPFPHSPPHGRPCPSCGQRARLDSPAALGARPQSRGSIHGGPFTGAHDFGMTLDRQSPGAPPDRRWAPAPRSLRPLGFHARGRLLRCSGLPPPARLVDIPPGRDEAEGSPGESRQGAESLLGRKAAQCPIEPDPVHAGVGTVRALGRIPGPPGRATSFPASWAGSPRPTARGART